MTKRRFLRWNSRMPSRPRVRANALRGIAAVPGWQDYCEGNLAAAVAAVSARLEVEPNDGHCFELLGLAYRDLAEPYKAADALERASLLVTIHSLSRLCLAECYAALQRLELARDLYLSQAEEQRDDAPFLLMIAAGLEAINEPELAMQLCRQAARIEPESGQIIYDMCFYAMRCGCPASLAESLAWRAVELEPENVHFRIGLSSLLLRMKQPDRACRVLRQLKGAQLRQLTCECCLQRIATLYGAAGDAARAQCCRQWMAELLRARTEANASQRP